MRKDNGKTIRHKKHCRKLMFTKSFCVGLECLSLFLSVLGVKSDYIVFPNDLSYNWSKIYNGII